MCEKASKQWKTGPVHATRAMETVGSTLLSACQAVFPLQRQPLIKINEALGQEQFSQSQ